MKILLLALAIFFTITGYSALAQADSSETSDSYHTYFIEQSALPRPKGTVVYSNNFFFINSLSYDLTDRLTISGGLSFLPTASPPAFISAKYVMPIARKLYVGASLAYVRLGYQTLRSDYLVVPQLLVTAGDINSHLTFSVGTTRGNFMLDDGLFGPSINLPERVNLITSLSYQKRFWKQFSFTTQNCYVSTKTVAYDTYSELALISAGAAYQLDKHALKFGFWSLHYPRSEGTKFSRALPYLGYTLILR